jgi:hypothetical protein
MGNAADPRQIRKAGQKERLAKQGELNDLRTVLETRPGRRFVWRQLQRAGVFRTSYEQGVPDRTAFNEGRRSNGLQLLADIHELDSSFYVLMQKESIDDEKKQEPEPPKEAKPTDEEETHE